MWESIIVAVITGIFALAGTYFANRKSAALMEYRLTQLEKKVDIHNSVIDRVYKLEGESDVQANDIKTIYHKLDKLEAKA